MNNKKYEIIGSIDVVDDANTQKKIVICQDILTQYKGSEAHTKRLFLETMYGQPVYRTDDPDIFRLFDGTTLKRKRLSK